MTNREPWRVSTKNGLDSGHYEILSLLGKGGMGEVWRARDTKLGREVAIKTLPEEFAKDPDRLARFEREAKLLASLNHPNIAAIHGFEEDNGTHFLVLELVEGDTLADRLKRGAIPVEESLKLALQIVEALEAAHEKGVIHRDLKPANIKVTPEGKVKVLDFGLAKAFGGDEADANLSNSPTLSMAATQQGVILGTAAYMSPEQAKGLPADKRADVFAFGCVLFEMLTGRQVFQGQIATEILASVIKEEPDYTTLRENLHPAIKKLLRRCLEKDPMKRFRDVGDVRFEIEQVLSDASGVIVHPVDGVVQAARQSKLPWVAGIIVSVVIAVAASWNLKPDSPPEVGAVGRFPLPLREGQNFNSLAFSSISISPDGTRVAYGTSGQIYLRNLNELQGRSLQGTEGTGAVLPTFSPDGDWLAYYSRFEGEVKRIPVTGGASITVFDAPIGDPPRDLQWTADDTLVFARIAGVYRVPATGGTPELIVPAEGEQIASARILPDGNSILFASTVGFAPNRWDEADIVLQSLDTGDRIVLWEGGSDPQYLPTGHLTFAQGDDVFAMPFDVAARETTGAPVPVIEGVSRGTLGALFGDPANYSFSVGGDLVYMPGNSGQAGGRFLTWVDRDGQEEPLDAPVRQYFDARISPDGTRAALAIDDGGNFDVWVWNLERSTLTRLTFHDGMDRYPLWSPDGEEILFYSERDGSFGVHRKAADGTGEVELLGSEPDRWLIPSSWSPDGNTLMLSELALTGDTNYDIGVLSMEGDRVWTSLIAEDHAESQPVVSADGWMAYLSYESGAPQIYVQPFPNIESGRWQVSTSSGIQPAWSSDGRELYYLDGNAMTVVSVATGDSFEFGTPDGLFRGNYFREVGRMWDRGPDGERFLMIKIADVIDEATSETVRPQMHVVLNWFEELKERVPVP